MIQMPTTCELDATRISPGIFQGSLPPTGTEVRDCGFHVLVLAASEYQPSSRMFPGVVVVRAPMEDAEITKTQWRLAIMTAYLIAEEIRKGKRVLVTCNAGRNRSGLIVALTLLLLTGERSNTIIRHVKARRRGALTNPTFVSAIRTFAG
jgi:protein-tyrosine phosphatase